MLGYQPQQRAIIIVNGAPVDERIGCWNVVEKQYKRVVYVTVNNKVIYCELQFYLFNVLSTVAYVVTAPS
jgi:hypothetical protein